MRIMIFYHNLVDTRELLSHSESEIRFAPAVLKWSVTCPVDRSRRRSRSVTMASLADSSLRSALSRFSSGLQNTRTLWALACSWSRVRSNSTRRAQHSRPRASTRVCSSTTSESWRLNLVLADLGGDGYGGPAARHMNSWSTDRDRTRAAVSGDAGAGTEAGPRLNAWRLTSDGSRSRRQNALTAYGIDVIVVAARGLPPPWVVDVDW